MWAGGKNKMIPKYLETPNIPKTGYDTFVEPFFGGGAMTIWIYKNCPDVKRFVINDVKHEIMGIYKAIKEDCELFLKRMDELSALYLPLDKAGRKAFYYNLRTEYTTDWTKWSYTVESASSKEASALSQTSSSPTLTSGLSAYFRITFSKPKSL